MKTKLVIAILALAILTGATYWFIRWNLNKSLQKMDWEDLGSVIEAPVGSFVSTTKSPQQRGPGALQYYQEHPDELERDKRYFQTWRSAFTIAISERDRGQEVEGWRSSASFQSIPPSNRTDAWGHTFCVRS